MPIVVGAGVVVALIGQQSVVNNGLGWMIYEISHRGIQGRHAADVISNAALVEVDADKCRQARMFGAVHYPEAGCLALCHIGQRLKRDRPQTLVHGRIVERLYRGEHALLGRHGSFVLPS
jgi:hypothetical protein